MRAVSQVAVQRVMFASEDGNNRLMFLLKIRDHECPVDRPPDHFCHVAAGEAASRACRGNFKLRQRRDAGLKTPALHKDLGNFCIVWKVGVNGAR